MLKLELRAYSPLARKTGVQFFLPWVRFFRSQGPSTYERIPHKPMQVRILRAEHWQLIRTHRGDAIILYTGRNSRLALTSLAGGVEVIDLLSRTPWIGRRKSISVSWNDSARNYIVPIRTLPGDVLAVGTVRGVVSLVDTESLVRQTLSLQGKPPVSLMKTTYSHAIYDKKESLLSKH